MNRNWHRTRGIDSLVRTSTPETLRAVVAGGLASAVAVVTLFRPIIAMVNSLDSGVPARLDVLTGAVIVLPALASVILSVKGTLEAKTKRTAWAVLCGLSLFALALSVTAAVAGTWFLRLYASIALGS